ncbi:hypothetical protein [Methylomonas fluvii]|uniref:Transmembrane protein n=1 Tax=Methylomonas fluvii TaxID=1854564 RepID=A0ABR9DAV4_9GAMM|nr:hypothetical protein [Methylomonas fluvii]MBD9360222.1 hypothetical protein [Methylomonas fluvii]CAD6873015.1 hypothetical protein [Methylomonas fluvii]
MNAFYHKLLILALILALPGLGCFSYYTLEEAGPNTALPALAITIAYPTLLISLTTLIMLRISKKPSRPGAWLAGSCLIISVAILLIARL